MGWLRFLRRKKWDEERADELRAYLETETTENIARGMSPSEANDAARRKLGNITQIREEIYHMNSIGFLETLWQDIRFALRMLRKNPGFTAVAVLTLALGIGANTAIFTVVYSALLRPLPYSHPEQIVALGETRDPNAASVTSTEVSYPDFLDWRKSSKSLQSLAGAAGMGVTLTGSAGNPEFVDAAQVTSNFFSVLGVKPTLGRDFVSGEDELNSPKVAILSYGYWQSQFGADQQVIGRSVRIDNESVSIVGVLPREFQFAPVASPAIWVPFHPIAEFMSRRNLRWFHVYGRLAPGASFAEADSEMKGITDQLKAAYPQENGKVFLVMAGLRKTIVGEVQPLLLILFGAVGLVLLIACANVANLLMVRAAGRRREIAVRTALGATRWALIRHFLTESLILSSAGGAFGLLAAIWGTPLLVGLIPADLLNSMPYLRNAQPDAAVVGFLCGAVIFTGILFGIAPALQASKTPVVEALKEDSHGSVGRSQTRLRDSLVVAEISLSLILLIGAGLLVKSLGALLHRDPGFETQNLLTFAMYLPDKSYPDEAAGLRLVKTLSVRFRSLPGVISAEEARQLPLTGSNGSIRFISEGHAVARGQEDECTINGDTPGYFSSMKIPLVAGRFFNDTDDVKDRPFHLIVNQAFVDRFIHGENPVGKRIRFTFSDKQPFREIVGVVGNTPSDLDEPMAPIIFLPFAQSPDSFFYFAVRTTASPGATLSAIRSAIHDTDPELALIQPRTMDQIIAQSPAVFARRFPSLLIGGFSILALALGTIGLYGLISYSVSQRTREIGIRVALGGGQGEILRLVIGQGARLALIGVAIGVAAALVFTRWMSALLYGISSNDPSTFAEVSVLLIVVAPAACYVPARRAMRVDPIVALRHE
jgi:predicted permease